MPKPMLKSQRRSERSRIRRGLIERIGKRNKLERRALQKTFECLPKIVFFGEVLNKVLSENLPEQADKLKP